MSDQKKKLEIDMSEVFSAMNIPDSYMLEFFLDLETGETRVLSGDSVEGDEDTFAAEIEESPDRFVQVPKYEAREKYDLMCRFAESVEEADIKSMLELALRGKGAFSRFRDVVYAYPDLKAAWQAMEQTAMLEAAEDWFDSLGIAPVYRLLREVPPARTAEPHPAARPRVDLLDMLLLGGPEGKTEILRGRVIRQFQAWTESEARAVFKSLARELCSYFGLAWRKRHVQGRTSFDIERAHLAVKGTTVELAIDVPVETWEAFQATRTG